MPSTLAEINACGPDRFVEILGPLFEHSPWVAEGTFGRRPFASPAALHAALCATLHSATHESRLALLRAHPDLAGRLARAGALTAASTAEQAAAGLDRLTPAEMAEIQSLNDTYKGRFGFPFIICARLNAKEAILAAMRRRVTQAPELELSTALDEIAKIAGLRLNEALAASS